MAKLDARRVGAFLDDPGRCRVVLLHGDDPGLIRERGDRLVAVVSGGDRLRVIEVAKEAARDTGLLAAEAATLALIGGRQVVRVRDAGDGFTPAAKLAIAGPGPGLVVLEGGELPGRSKLRALLEPAAEAAVIACYRERGAELAGSIGRTLGELGVKAEPAATEWLAGRLGDDRQLMRRALEALALQVGEGGLVTPEAAMAAVAGGSALDLEEALIAALAGDLALADQALEQAFAEGAAAVQVVRGALRQVQRLQAAAAAMAAGASASAAIEALRPPVFFRHKPQLERALRAWRPAALAAAGAGLLEAERRTKTTGLPDQAVARMAVLSLARQAALLSRR